MRRLAIVLISAAVFTGCTPPPANKPKSSPTGKPSAGPSSGTTTSSLPSDKSVRLVKMSVPNMSCPHSCWPEVKKVLEQQDGVVKVELAKQPSPDEITDRTVYLALNGAFDSDRAMAELSRIGYEGSTLVASN